MNILVFNQGSSSLKWSLYDFSDFKNQIFPPIFEEQIEWKHANNIDSLELKNKILSSLQNRKIDAIGHRVVHGKDLYKDTTLITEEVKQKIQSFASLAPLHNFNSFMMIDLMEKIFPQIVQFAVFDTAFHQTMPEKAFIYPGPYEWIEKKIRRFGFHGISFEYSTHRAFELFQQSIDKMVICHLGAGASLCAVKQGKSIDTTMGFTPLEGLMMNTRSGSIDPGIIFFLLEEEKKKIQDLKKELYEKSGLLGISGLSDDIRDVLEARSRGNERATVAIDLYLHRIISSIGSMIASLKGIDALIFTGGIAEHLFFIQKKIGEAFSFLGMDLDENQKELNKEKDQILSAPSSKVKVAMIHAREDFLIASKCYQKKNLRDRKEINATLRRV